MNAIVDRLVMVMHTLGAPGVGLAVAVENVFPPLPSEVFLPLAGFAAARRDGRRRGDRVVDARVARGRGRPLRDRRGAGPATAASARGADAAGVGAGPRPRRGLVRPPRRGAVFLGRMVPLVRSLISVPAGVERMPLALFALLTAAGSLIWNTAFVLAGYALGANWPVVERYAGMASKFVLTTFAVVVVVAALRRLDRRSPSSR